MASPYTLPVQAMMALTRRPAVVAVFGDRVFPGKVPKANVRWPALVYQAVTGHKERGMRRLTGVEFATFQLRIAAKQEDAVDAAWQALSSDWEPPANLAQMHGPGWRIDRLEFRDCHMLEDPETAMPYAVGSLIMKIVKVSNDPTTTNP